MMELGVRRLLSKRQTANTPRLSVQRGGEAPRHKTLRTPESKPRPSRLALDHGRQAEREGAWGLSLCFRVPGSECEVQGAGVQCSRLSWVTIFEVGLGN